MKKLISFALLFIIVFNLVSCFDTDDLFDNVITPEGSVPENTEKSTEIEFTEEPTEVQTEEIIEDVPTEEIATDDEIKIIHPNGNYTIKKSATVSASVLETDYDAEDVDILYKMISACRDPNEDWASESASEVIAPVNGAYVFQCSAFYFLENFGSCTSLGENMLMSLCENVHIIDGSIIADECSESVFIAMKSYSPQMNFKKVSSVSFENGKLTLCIDYFASESNDDWNGGHEALIEIDKALLGREKITSIEFVFNGEIYFYKKS